MTGKENSRVARVEREIREIVAQYLIRGLRNSVQGMVTVTRVWVSKDLRLARIYVTILGGDPKEGLETLRDSVGEIQYHLGRELKTKFCPTLEIFYDESLEKSLEVQGTLRNLEEERKRRGQGETE